MFNTLYKKCLNLAAHQSSKYYLAIVSFVESSIFPIPPDVMIAPMVVSRKKDFLKIFIIATVFSVLDSFVLTSNPFLRFQVEVFLPSSYFFFVHYLNLHWHRPFYIHNLMCTVDSFLISVYCATYSTVVELIHEFHLFHSPDHSILIRSGFWAS